MTSEKDRPIERPIAEFVLSLLAGVMLLARSGMMYGGMHGAWDRHMEGWMESWGPRAFAVGWPWFGTIGGLVLIVAAVALFVRPEARRGWGVVILVTSSLQLLLGMGGFVAGVLGLVAGVLAVRAVRPASVS